MSELELSYCSTCKPQAYMMRTGGEGAVGVACAKHKTKRDTSERQREKKIRCMNGRDLLHV